MSKLLKSIDIELTAASINAAIREINMMANQLEEQCLELVRLMQEEGVSIAKMQVMALDAVMTGDLEQSIKGVFDKERGVGIVYSDVPHALFVEFGTGVEGDRTFHDMSGAENINWEYDTNQHGDNGWWYPAPWGWWIPKEGAHAGEPMAWTKGMPARPFMLDTLRWLEEIAPERASGMFNQM